jgi:hypothetical protein
MSADYLTIESAALLLGLGRERIYQFGRAGLLPRQRITPEIKTILHLRKGSPARWCYLREDVLNVRQEQAKRRQERIDALGDFELEPVEELEMELDLE